MVMLAMRPYGGYYYNLGRETFLAPVRWEEDWPIVSPGSGRVEFEFHTPGLSEHRWPSQPACDSFETEDLALCWNFVRAPRGQWWSLTERPGYLRLYLRPGTLSERTNPCFIGQRQRHISFAARAAMEFTPTSTNDCAGIALRQSEDFHYRFVVTQDTGGSTVARLVKREHGKEMLVAEQPVESKRYYFKVEAKGQEYGFYVAIKPEAWQAVAEAVDGRILSTPVADGFVGAYIGMYASSNGQSSHSPTLAVADFDWFEYVGLLD
jgi:alpha-N-arabinofuranosidase